jgi:hypothetical protein
MKARVRFLSRQLLAMLLCVSVAFAQTPPAAPTQPVFTQQELDQMLAPIALYPDSLLSQILMASTYPIEIVQAARWSKANPNLKGDEAVKAVEQNNWDPSVKSLVAFPQILAMLDEKLDWMERLGDAFLSQQQQVMDTVQSLRQKAEAAGNLKSDERVRVESQPQSIVIEQANPEVVYVPYYDPYVVYGPWWWPGYPPVYWGPWPGYYAYPGYGAGFWWGVGITVGFGFFFGAFDWPHHHATIVNVYPHYYRPPPHAQNVPPGHWAHDAGHRRGVPYRDPVLREQFGRRDARPEARRDYRGNEPYRQQSPGTPGIRPEAREVPGSRPAQSERTRPGSDGRPYLPDAGRPEPRSAPAQPTAPGAPGRPNVPDAGRPEPRNVPNAPNVYTAPGRQNVPDRARAELRQTPVRPTAPAVQRQPAVEPRPHIFEGVGQGPAVRDYSARGRISSERIAPATPGARPQGASPAPRQGGSAPQQRPSGGGQSHGGQARPPQR